MIGYVYLKTAELAPSSSLQDFHIIILLTSNIKIMGLQFLNLQKKTDQCQQCSSDSSRLRPEPDYPAGTGTGIPVPVSRNRILIMKFRFRYKRTGFKLFKIRFRFEEPEFSVAKSGRNRI